MKSKITKDIPSAQERRLRDTLDANPSFLLLVDRDARIVMANRTAAKVLGEEPRLLLRRVCGEVLQCSHGEGPSNACGSSDHCRVCGIQTSVQAAAKGDTVMPREFSMVLNTPGGHREVRFLVTATPFDFEGARLVLLSLEDVTGLVQLRGTKPAS